MLGFALAAVGAFAVTSRVRQARRRQASLFGSVAIVTGGSRGLGFLIARELARAGCRLSICARDAAELDRARAELERHGAEVIGIRCDVADPVATAALVAETESRLGPVDILVNNASIIQVAPVEALGPREFQHAMAVNFWGVVHPTLAVLPRMRARRRGRIVNITSIGGKVSVPHLLPYGAAKFAAVGFSEGLTAEVAKDGVRVTTVVPGLMRTGSYLNAEFEGRPAEEFTWFALGSTLPLVSMDAERAARRIVRAIRRGEREPILSLPAQILARTHGLFPGTVVGALGLVNRLLPDAGDTRGHARGLQLQRAAGSGALYAVTRLGRAAARRFNQYPPQTRTT
ncbi:MAG TPA: SDR family oxidoreductase [Methylomirabilota bacterium]|jgi:short-subunit dehydrogenase|nr:SDR family oxidoreductase [Methylomirabilota bacterium]